MSNCVLSWETFVVPEFGALGSAATLTKNTNGAPQNTAYTYSTPSSTDHAAEHTFPGSRHVCMTRPYCPGLFAVSTCHITNRLLEPKDRSRNAYR
jgi:hypothetical protein